VVTSCSVCPAGGEQYQVDGANSTLEAIPEEAREEVKQQLSMLQRLCGAALGFAASATGRGA